MPQPRTQPGYVYLMSKIVPRINKPSTGRQPGAVPILDLIEAWGYDSYSPEVIAMAPLLGRWQVNGFVPTREIFERAIAAHKQAAIEAASPASPPQRPYAGPPIVYFIRGHERVKIGTTTNLKRRLTAMSQPPDVVMATIPGDRNVERQMHTRFAHLRIDRTEWFRMEPDLAAFIESIQGGAT